MPIKKEGRYIHCVLVLARFRWIIIEAYRRSEPVSPGVSGRNYWDVTMGGATGGGDIVPHFWDPGVQLGTMKIVPATFGPGVQGGTMKMILPGD